MKQIFFFLLVVFLCSCSEEEDNTLTPQDYPEIVNGTLNYQNLDREYILHIPESFDGTSAAPLVIFLHGGGGNAESAQGFTNFNTISDENGFIVAYPQASFEASPNSFVWADGRGLPPDSQGIDDVGFIVNLTTELQREYNIDSERVYLCGFSNGSFLTQKIAFENNSQFAAIGTLGGTMSESQFSSGNPGRAIPMIYVFGTDDPLVPYEGGFVSDNQNLEPVVGVVDAVNFWRDNNATQNALSPVNVANSNTSDNSSVTIYEYTDGNCESAVKYYEVTGGGHTWPGVTVPNAELGETNLDILASRELWDFFSQFTLCSQ